MRMDYRLSICTQNNRNANYVEKVGINDMNSIIQRSMRTRWGPSNTIFKFVHPNKKNMTSAKTRIKTLQYEQQSMGKRN